MVCRPLAKMLSASVLIACANERPDIIKSGVCLGRTPGFRRAAVDSALVLATSETF